MMSFVHTVILDILGEECRGGFSSGPFYRHFFMYPILFRQ